MTPRKPKPRKQKTAKPVLAWGIVWDGRLTTAVFTRRKRAKDFAWLDKGERIVRVEVREYTK